MKSDELNDLFDYGYKIYQNAAYFKFSIDSILLAEFVKVRKGKNTVIDLCSGNLPIPLILHKKFGSKINITAVELQDAIYDLGVKTLDYNAINEIKYYKADVCDFSQLCKGCKYDIVTCNPPYFKIDKTSYLNQNNVKSIQRHEVMIDLERLFKTVAKIIQNQGYFYLVHRPSRFAEIVDNINKYNFGIKRIVPVYDNHTDSAVFFLIESVFNGKSDVSFESPVYLSDNNSYQNIFESE